MRPPTRRERMRFRPRQWAHGPKLVEHDPGGEQWRGFAAAKELTDIAPGIAIISLPGHTRGHACIAVDAGNRWILHCGDAFYQHATLTGERVPFGLNAFDKLFAFDRNQARANKGRLVERGARSVHGVRPRQSTVRPSLRHRVVPSVLPSHGQLLGVHTSLGSCTGRAAIDHCPTAPRRRRRDTSGPNSLIRCVGAAEFELP